MSKIATWNVNSIKARLPIVIDWLEHFQPDIVLLQETKTVDEGFPKAEIEDLGYNVAMVGQKSYNGVAILSKSPIEDVITKLPGEGINDDARYIEAVVGNTRVASVYVVNGQEVGSEKFAYKMHFMKCLKNHVAKTLEYEEVFVLGGDFNIAPDECDVYDPIKLSGSLHFSQPERDSIKRILNLGMTDSTRIYHPKETDLYSWWDYRAGSWQQNKGLRIDLMLLSPQAADRLVGAGIDKSPRSEEKTSDHTPVWCTLDKTILQSE